MFINRKNILSYPLQLLLKESKPMYKTCDSRTLFSFYISSYANRSNI